MKLMMISLVIISALVSMGCQAVSVKRIDTKDLKKSGKVHGIIYYEPVPFLEITASPKVDKTGALTGYQTSSRVVYLPNPNVAYAINSDRSGGTNSLDLTLKDGWMLTGLKGTTDPQIDESIKAVAELIGKISPTEAVVKSNNLVAKVYLLKIKIDKAGNLRFGKAVPVELPI
tara:strand:+ start:158 stop:676 length:519 start_codon:yes stop_codon:yes gene_type:complete